MAEHVPGAGAVDLGGFVEGGVNVLESGEVEDHVGAAHGDPHEHDQDGGFGEQGVAEPVGSFAGGEEAEGLEGAVEEAVVGVVDLAPDHVEGDAGGDGG